MTEVIKRIEKERKDMIRRNKDLSMEDVIESAVEKGEKIVEKTSQDFIEFFNSAGIYIYINECRYINLKFSENIAAIIGVICMIVIIIITLHHIRKRVKKKKIREEYEQCSQGMNNLFKSEEELDTL